MTKPASKAKTAGVIIAALAPGAGTGVFAWQAIEEKKLEIELHQTENEQERFRLEIEASKVASCMEEFSELARACGRSCLPRQ